MLKHFVKLHLLQMKKITAIDDVDVYGVSQQVINCLNKYGNNITVGPFALIH